MPLWLPIPPPVFQALQQPAPVQQPASVTQKIDEFLVVSAQSASYDPLTQIFIFRSGVTATYDVTTIKADRLEIHMAEGEQWAKATGNVSIIDPEASITAEDLDFTWKPDARSAKAKNVKFQLGHAHIEAEEADLNPDRWEFRRVSATNCPDLYWIRSPRLVVIPGRRGTLEDPSLHAFGRKLVTLPDRNFNLDPRTQGISLPSVSVRRDGGLGINWDAGVLLNENTNIYGNASIFKGTYPSFGLIATRSSVPVSRANAILTPGTEIGERFRFGYLENIEIARPSQESRFLRTERQSISVGSLWNQGVGGRDYDTVVSKAVEGVYETGGVFGAKKVTRNSEEGKPETVTEGGLGYFGQLRLQTIRERGGPFVSRAMAIGSVELPSVALAPNVSTLSRIDMTQFLGGNSYGWTRAIVGVVYEPNEKFRLSGGLVGSLQHGTPQFRFDQLVAERGFHVRADLNLGPTKISYLTKYDTSLRWYDREYMISQVAGCFEPFLLYRKFPSDYKIGIRLRLDNLYDIVQRRQFQRDPTKKTVISSEGHK